jgi:hypothetical protein
MGVFELFGRLLSDEGLRGYIALYSVFVCPLLILICGAFSVIQSIWYGFCNETNIGSI